MHGESGEKKNGLR